jgi:hypothetical protein
MIKENFMDTSQDKAAMPFGERITKGPPPAITKGINDLPFKVKTDEWKEIKQVGKFPMTYKDLIDYD